MASQEDCEDAYTDDTTPVEAYSQGVSPSGVLDMVGNVFEWTRSLWWGNTADLAFKYPYNPEDGRENLDAPRTALRVMRGGFFGSGLQIARCARHNVALPDDRGRDIGFRVVMYP
jgi:formylglycine-generating enzyme required for sulfatase activity